MAGAKKKSVRVALAAFASMALVFGSAGPASAVTRSGTTNCNYTSMMSRVYKNPSGLYYGPGYGYWFNREGPEIREYLFHKGPSVHLSPYKNVRWSLSAPGFNDPQPYGWCA